MAGRNVWGTKRNRWGAPSSEGGGGQTIQVSTLPTASASELGKIYQYVGATTADYTNGYFYKCVSDGGSYSWQVVDVDNSVPFSGVTGSPADNAALAAALNGKADATDLTAHTGDAAIHVTAADKTAWNGKADKVANATANHLAKLDANGNIVDAGFGDAPADGTIYARINGSWTGIQGELVYENVSINLSARSGSPTLSGLPVVVSFTDGGAAQTLTTDSNGNCSLQVLNGRTYVITAPDVTGYNTPFQQRYVAHQLNNYVFLVYEVPSAATDCTVVVQCSILGGSLGSTLLQGKNINIVLSDNTARYATIDSNGNATFNNVTRGLTGFVTFGNAVNLPGYINPSPVMFSTNTTSVNLTAQWGIKTAGLFMVKSDGTEVDYYSWQSGDTCVALHIATQTLIEKNGDFFVKPQDLATMLGYYQWYEEKLLALV